MNHSEKLICFINMGKKEDVYKMTVIINLQMMWDKIGVEHELSLKEMMKMNYEELWEKQMDVKYLYNKSFTK